MDPPTARSGGPPIANRNSCGIDGDDGADDAAAGATNSDVTESDIGLETPLFYVNTPYCLAVYVVANHLCVNTAEALRPICMYPTALDNAAASSSANKLSTTTISDDSTAGTSMLTNGDTHTSNENDRLHKRDEVPNGNNSSNDRKHNIKNNVTNKNNVSAATTLFELLKEYLSIFGLSAEAVFPLSDQGAPSDSLYSYRFLTLEAFLLILFTKVPNNLAGIEGLLRKRILDFIRKSLNVMISFLQVKQAPVVTATPTPTSGTTPVPTPTPGSCNNLAPPGPPHLRDTTSFGSCYPVPNGPIGPGTGNLTGLLGSLAPTILTAASGVSSLCDPVGPGCSLDPLMTKITASSHHQRVLAPAATGNMPSSSSAPTMSTGVPNALPPHLQSLLGSTLSSMLEPQEDHIHVVNGFVDRSSAAPSSRLDVSTLLQRGIATTSTSSDGLLPIRIPQQPTAVVPNGTANIVNGSPPSVLAPPPAVNNCVAPSFATSSDLMSCPNTLLQHNPTMTAAASEQPGSGQSVQKFFACNGPADPQLSSQKQILSLSKSGSQSAHGQQQSHISSSGHHAIPGGLRFQEVRVNGSCVGNNCPEGSIGAPSSVIHTSKTLPTPSVLLPSSSSSQLSSLSASSVSSSFQPLTSSSMSSSAFFSRLVNHHHQQKPPTSITATQCFSSPGPTSSTTPSATGAPLSASSNEEDPDGPPPAKCPRPNLTTKNGEPIATVVPSSSSCYELGNLSTLAASSTIVGSPLRPIPSYNLEPVSTKAIPSPSRIPAVRTLDPTSTTAESTSKEGPRTRMIFLSSISGSQAPGSTTASRNNAIHFTDGLLNNVLHNPAHSTPLTSQATLSMAFTGAGLGGPLRGLSIPSGTPGSSVPAGPHCGDVMDSLVSTDSLSNNTRGRHVIVDTGDWDDESTHCYPVADAAPHQLAGVNEFNNPVSVNNMTSTHSYADPGCSYNNESSQEMTIVSSAVTNNSFADDELSSREHQQQMLPRGSMMTIVSVPTTSEQYNNSPELQHLRPMISLLEPSCGPGTTVIYENSGAGSKVPSDFLDITSSSVPTASHKNNMFTAKRQQRVDNDSDNDGTTTNLLQVSSLKDL